MLGNIKAVALYLLMAIFVQNSYASETCTSYASSLQDDAFTLNWNQSSCSNINKEIGTITRLCWKKKNSLHTLCEWEAGTITRDNQPSGSYQFTGKQPCTVYKWSVEYWGLGGNFPTYYRLPQDGNGTITTQGCN